MQVRNGMVTGMCWLICCFYSFTTLDTLDVLRWVGHLWMLGCALCVVQERSYRSFNLVRVGANLTLGRGDWSLVVLTFEGFEFDVVRIFSFTLGGVSVLLLIVLMFTLGGGSMFSITPCFMLVVNIGGKVSSWSSGFMMLLFVWIGKAMEAYWGN